MHLRFLCLVLVLSATSSSAQEDLLACVDPDVRQGLLSPTPGGAAVVSATVPAVLAGLLQSEELEFIGSSVSDSQTFVAYKSALASVDAMETAGSAQDLLEHFEQQLEGQGWVLDMGWIGDISSGSSWSRAATVELELAGLLDVVALDDTGYRASFRVSSLESEWHIKAIPVVRIAGPGVVRWERQA